MALPSMIKVGRIVNKCQLFVKKPTNLVAKAFLGYGWHHLRYSDERATKFDKVAIVLSGCGMADGTEIFEATATAIALSYVHLQPEFYASSLAFMHANNHVTGDFEDDFRLPIVESGRITGGPVKLLVELTTERAGGIILPGGFGVNAALTDYYMNTTNFNFTYDVLSVLQNFYRDGRPIAFIGMAGIMAARMFPEIKMTMGNTGDVHKWPYSEAIDHAREMSADMILQDVNSHTFDETYGVFTTPGFMYNGSYHEIYQGISCMVRSFAEYTKREEGVL